MCFDVEAKTIVPTSSPLLQMMEVEACHGIGHGLDIVSISSHRRRLFGNGGTSADRRNSYDYDHIEVSLCHQRDGILNESAGPALYIPLS